MPHNLKHNYTAYAEKVLYPRCYLEVEREYCGSMIASFLLLRNSFI